MTSDEQRVGQVESRSHRDYTCPTGLNGGRSDPDWRLNVCVLIGLAAMTAVIGGRDISVGGLSWSDAPLHAMDGVLLHDVLVEHPAGSLRAWAEQYYLRHQCLGLIVYYPPLFAAVEAVAYLICGISVWAARLTVLLFAIGAVWMIYLLGRELFGVTAGLVAAVMAMASPAGVAWSRQVMLEWPAVFFIGLALVAYCRYLRRACWHCGAIAMLSCAAAYLTKQTAVFVLVLMLLHAWWEGHWPRLLRPSFVIPAACSVLVIVAYGVATGGANALAPQLLFGDPPLRHVMRTESWMWYLTPGRLATIIGWPMLAAFVATVAIVLLAYLRDYVGLVRSVIRGREHHARAIDDESGSSRSLMLPATWFFLWYVICSVLVAKEERYFFFAVPAIALLAAGALIRLDGRRPFGIGSALLAIVFSLQVFNAASTPARRLPDMKPTVDFLAATGDADLVLVDSVRDGQLIFDVRTSPRARGRIIPMRASKFLYARAARTRYDYQTYVHTPAELYTWLAEYGIRYIVMEDRLPDTPDRSWDVPPRVMLRETVTDNPRFERVFTQSLAGDDPVWRDVNLVTYRYLDAKPRRRDTITVHVPAMDRTITLTLPSAATRTSPD